MKYVKIEKKNFKIAKKAMKKKYMKTIYIAVLK